MLGVDVDSSEDAAGVVIMQPAMDNAAISAAPSRMYLIIGTWGFNAISENSASLASTQSD